MRHRCHTGARSGDRTSCWAHNRWDLAAVRYGPTLGVGGVELAALLERTGRMGSRLRLPGCPGGWTGASGAIAAAVSARSPAWHDCGSWDGRADQGPLQRGGTKRGGQRPCAVAERGQRARGDGYRGASDAGARPIRTGGFQALRR